MSATDEQDDETAVWRGLVSVLLDESCEWGDRDDAAMDLEYYANDDVVAALRSVIDDPAADPDLVDSCRESLMGIERRRRAGST